MDAKGGGSLGSIQGVEDNKRAVQRILILLILLYREWGKAYYSKLFIVIF